MFMYIHIYMLIYVHIYIYIYKSTCIYTGIGPRARPGWIGCAPSDAECGQLNALCPSSKQLWHLREGTGFGWRFL